MISNPPRKALKPQLLHAVELVRRTPLRWTADAGVRTAKVARERGWFEGAGECARALAAEARMDIVQGRGFGGSWPLLVGDTTVLAPAMPVAVGTQREGGSDGDYRLIGDTIWREAVGVEGPFLSADDSQPPPGHPFDLLWFGESERFTLRSGFLEISDLFGELRVPASTELLENLLVRGRRLHRDVFSSLRCTDCEGEQTIEVRRPSILSANERSLDARAFLDARADVEHAREVADRIVVRTVDGAESAFDLQELVSGWRLTLLSGNYAFASIQLERGETTLSIRASLACDLDGLAPGMRGRLIFDLRSDLVALS